MDSVVILKAWGQGYGGRRLGNDGANKYELSIRRGSGGTVAHEVKQLTQRLIEAFEPLFVDAMPGIVHGTPSRRPTRFRIHRSRQIRREAQAPAHRDPSCVAESTDESDIRAPDQQWVRGLSS